MKIADLFQLLVKSVYHMLNALKKTTSLLFKSWCVMGAEGYVLIFSYLGI